MKKEVTSILKQAVSASIEGAIGGTTIDAQYKKFFSGLSAKEKSSIKEARITIETFKELSTFIANLLELYPDMHINKITEDFARIVETLAFKRLQANPLMEEIGNLIIFTLLQDIEKQTQKKDKNEEKFLKYSNAYLMIKNLVDVYDRPQLVNNATLNKCNEIRAEVLTKKINKLLDGLLATAENKDVYKIVKNIRSLAITLTDQQIIKQLMQRLKDQILSSIEVDKGQILSSIEVDKDSKPTTVGETTKRYLKIYMDMKVQFSRDRDLSKLLTENQQIGEVSSLQHLLGKIDKSTKDSGSLLKYLEALKSILTGQRVSSSVTLSTNRKRSDIEKAHTRQSQTGSLQTDKQVRTAKDRPNAGHLPPLAKSQVLRPNTPSSAVSHLSTRSSQPTRLASFRTQSEAHLSLTQNSNILPPISPTTMDSSTMAPTTQKMPKGKERVLPPSENMTPRSDGNKKYGIFYQPPEYLAGKQDESSSSSAILDAPRQFTPVSSGPAAPQSIEDEPTPAFYNQSVAVPQSPTVAGMDEISNSSSATLGAPQPLTPVPSVPAAHAAIIDDDSASASSTQKNTNNIGLLPLSNTTLHQIIEEKISIPSVVLPQPTRAFRWHEPVQDDQQLLQAAKDSSKLISRTSDGDAFIQRGNKEEQFTLKENSPTMKIRRASSMGDFRSTTLSPNSTSKRPNVEQMAAGLNAFQQKTQLDELNAVIQNTQEQLRKEEQNMYEGMLRTFQEEQKSITQLIKQRADTTQQTYMIQQALQARDLKLQKEQEEVIQLKLQFSLLQLQVEEQKRRNTVVTEESVEAQTGMGTLEGSARTRIDNNFLSSYEELLKQQRAEIRLLQQMHQMLETEEQERKAILDEEQQVRSTMSVDLSVDLLMDEQDKNRKLIEQTFYESLILYLERKRDLLRQAISEDEIKGRMGIMENQAIIGNQEIIAQELKEHNAILKRMAEEMDRYNQRQEEQQLNAELSPPSLLTATPQLPDNKSNMLTGKVGQSFLRAKREERIKKLREEQQIGGHHKEWTRPEEENDTSVTILPRGPLGQLRDARLNASIVDSQHLPAPRVAHLLAALKEESRNGRHDKQDNKLPSELHRVTVLQQPSKLMQPQDDTLSEGGALPALGKVSTISTKGPSVSAKTRSGQLESNDEKYRQFQKSLLKELDTEQPSPRYNKAELHRIVLKQPREHFSRRTWRHVSEEVQPPIVPPTESTLPEAPKQNRLPGIHPKKGPK